MTAPRKLRVWPKSEGETTPGGQSELAAWAGIGQSLADGEAGALRQLAARARELSGSVFVAIAREASESHGVSFIAADGPAGIETALGQISFAPFWRAALEERRVTSSEVEPGCCGTIRFPDQPVQTVLGIPLRARGETLGLLIAGLGRGTDAEAAQRRLEEWTPLAALALAVERRANVSQVRNHWLAALLDSMENAVLMIEADGRIRLANSRLPLLLGIPPERMAKLRTIEELMAEARSNFRNPRVAETRWREIQRREDEVAWDEVELAHPVPRLLERFARPVRTTDGERLGWLELYREAGEERLLRSRLSQMEKLAGIGQLVSGIAHELNNPLTSIVGYAQLLLQRSGGSGRDEETLHIFEQAQRAGTIVRSLLLMARGEKPEHKPVNLNEIVNQTVAMRNYQLRVSNIRIELDLEPGLPVILGDSHQLKQMMLNLLINAEQAIEAGRGRGTIHISTGRPRTGQPRTVALEVCDDGVGIPREIAPSIFDPFFTTKRAGAGTGLGLSIVSNIVREHGGEVRVEPGPERGSRFVVEFPAGPWRQQEARGPEGEKMLAAAAVREHPTGGRKRVLVVEDEPTVASLVADVLREEGHEVETILDSVAALERLTRQDFDLVICDLKMPKLDGRALYEEGIRRGRLRRDRVLFITGDTMRPRTLDFVHRDRLPFLAKPFLVDELTRKVRDLLNDHASRTNAGRPATTDYYVQLGEE